MSEPCVTFRTTEASCALALGRKKGMMWSWVWRCFQFFVASDPTVKNDRLWHDKYSLRKSMIPSFLSIDQARRVSSRYSETPIIKQKWSFLEIPWTSLAPWTFLWSVLCPLLQESNWWQKDKWFVCFCIVCSFEKGFLKNMHPDFFVWLESILFNLLCVFRAFWHISFHGSLFLTGEDHSFPTYVFFFFFYWRLVLKCYMPEKVHSGSAPFIFWCKWTSHQSTTAMVVVPPPPPPPKKKTHTHTHTKYSTENGAAPKTTCKPTLWAVVCCSVFQVRLPFIVAVGATITVGWSHSVCFLQPQVVQEWANWQRPL